MTYEKPHYIDILDVFDGVFCARPVAIRVNLDSAITLKVGGVEIPGQDVRLFEIIPGDYVVRAEYDTDYAVKYNGEFIYPIDGRIALEETVYLGGVANIVFETPEPLVFEASGTSNFYSDSRRGIKKSQSYSSELIPQQVKDAYDI